jgi:hypothetical protein
MSFGDGALIPKQILSLYRQQQRAKNENIFKENMTILAWKRYIHHRLITNSPLSLYFQLYYATVRNSIVQ